MANRGEELIISKFSKKFEEYNTNTLKKIAETIKQFKGLNYTEAYKLGQMLKYDKSYADIIDDLSKLTNETKKEIKGMLEEEAKQNVEFADTYYKAKDMKTPVFEESNVLQNIVNSTNKLSVEDFDNISRSTGFTFLDKDNHIKFLNMKDTYFKVIDDSVYAVSQGKDTFDNVMRNTINQLAESGVKRLVYANDGKRQYTERIDTAVRRNILDSIRQVSNEVEFEVGKEFGADGVEITVHEHPAPDHADIQGKQFSYKEYQKLQEGKRAKDYKGHFHQIKHSKKGGYRPISQYNCYHKIMSINLGVDSPQYTDEQLKEIENRNNQKVEIDGKEYTKYEATQLQRQLETEIRKSKDKHIMYSETGDRLSMLKEQKRITQLTRKYKEVSRKANIGERLDRASVSGYRPIKSLKPPKELYENKTDDVIKSSILIDNKKDIFKNVVQGKDLTSSDEFDVNKLIKEQGFDGKPILIKKEDEFEKLVKDDTVGMYRGIYGKTKEEVDKYKKMLRHGEFVPNSDNMSVSGKGLYTVAYKPNDIKTKNSARELAEKYAGFRSMFSEPGTKVDYKETGYVERFTFTNDVKLYKPKETERILKDYEIIKKGYDGYYNRDGDFVIILNRTKMIILDK